MDSFATSQESSREWETLKYDSFFIPNTVFNNLDAPIPSSALSTCPETGLTAFSQLAALRLGTSRALISLFDRQYQYIVAEATPTVPLRANVKHVQKHLWLCGTAIPRSYGICEHVLNKGDETEACDPNEANMKNKSTLAVSIVPDLSTDPRFCDRPFVNDAPRHRFYAGVPIRSPRGYNIGVLCVFDDQPRETLDQGSIEFMTDLSDTIMDYMDSRLVNDRYMRSERMVRGLGKFIQGKDQPESWWEMKHQATHANRQQRNIEHSPERDVVVTEDGVEVHDEAANPSKPEEVPCRPDINPMTGCKQDSATPMPESSSSVETTNSITTDRTNTPQMDPQKAEVINIFDRAANVIRESLDVDGTLFLDASVGSFGGLVAPSLPRSPGEELASSSSDDSSSGQSQEADDCKPCKVFSISTKRDPITDNRGRLNQSSLTEKFLKKLLRRYPKGKIFSYDEGGLWYSGESSGNESESARSDNSPNGDGDGSANGRNSPHSTRSTRKRASPYSRRNEAKMIGQIFPGARSVAVVPLWDAAKERWLAGGFIWSNTASRILTTDADLPYLRAFGMITMAEITHLDVMAADKAKTDILGSLSHELRSPLHGVVAAAELMHDTSLDSFQVDVVHTIEISGKTLLDTIDHLLAYSKINTFLRASKSQKKNNRVNRGMSQDGKQQEQVPHSIESGMMTLVSDVTFDVLAEEVIESVFIGHSFQHMVAQQLTRHGASGDMHPAQERLDTIYSADMSNNCTTPAALPTNIGDVQVIIDIDPHKSWNFHTQPGAIRRIIMNIFGNALKYTVRGHVKISLKQEARSPSQPKHISKVTLTVSDTGKGISEQFLRDKLFTPFSQEDQLAPGTGLGLSLVRQIVVSLGGSISVKSNLGEGTTVSVTIPLAISNKVGHEHSKSDRLTFDKKMLDQLKVATVGFSPAAGSPAPAPEGFRPSTTLSLESLPLKWYNMELCEDNDSSIIPADAQLAIYSEVAFDQMSAEYIQNHKLPGVIVCHSAASSIKLDAMLRRKARNVVFEFIHQPVTPRKFGKTVSSAMARWKQMQVAQSAGPLPLPSEPESEPTAVPKRTSSVRFTESPGTNEPPRFTSPQAKKMSDVACRFWNLDIDPEFTLSLPRRRNSQATLTDAKPQANDGDSTDSGPQDPAVAAAGQSSRASPDSACDVDSGVDGGTSSPEASAAAENKAAEMEGQDLDAGPETRGSHFLVVDDNPLNLRLLCTFMKRMGRDFATAVNGLEALETYMECPTKFSCILMDINMPIMDGLESTRKIRQHERQNRLSAVTVIAITGLGSTSAREEAFASGLDLFLTRPVRMQELRGILEERGLGNPPAVKANGEAAPASTPAGTTPATA